MTVLAAALGQTSAYATSYQACGSAYLPPYQLFDRSEIELLASLQARLDEEKVRSGDAGDVHDIHVRRIMLDKPGELPRVVNSLPAERIIRLLREPQRERVLKELIGDFSDVYLRRCQINRMTERSFIGLHLDAASNPDYEWSMVVQLGQDFTGGEFVVHLPNGDTQVFEPTYGSVILSTCKLRHEVWPVRSGERTSLVAFYAKAKGPNPRVLHKE